MTLNLDASPWSSDPLLWGWDWGADGARGLSVLEGLQGQNKISGHRIEKLGFRAHSSGSKDPDCKAAGLRVVVELEVVGLRFRIRVHLMTVGNFELLGVLVHGSSILPTRISHNHVIHNW